MLRDKLLIVRFSRLGRIPPAQYFAEIVHERGLPVLVFEFGEGAEIGLFEHKKPPRLRHPCSNSRRVPKFLRSATMLFEAFSFLVGEITRSGKPRLVIAHGLMEEAIALGLNVIFKIPYAVHVHEIYNAKDLSRFNRLLFRLSPVILQRALFTIFPETTRAQVYAERYGLKRAPYIAFNCPRLTPKVSPGSVRHSWKFKQRTSILLYMGGLADKNAVLESIEALTLLPDSGLVLAGWSDAEFETRMRSQADKLGVSDRVRWIGAVKDRWAYLAAADISICLYRHDELRTQHQATASNKLFEAGTQGIPVLVSGSTDFTDFLARYPIGVAAKDLSARSIAEAANKILENRTFADGISKRARQLHEERFNYETQIVPILHEIFALFPEVDETPNIPLVKRL